MSRSAALLDLATRLALFVLASVATLAIVGALVAIPGDVARTLAGLEERVEPPVEPQRSERQMDMQGDSANGMPASAGMTGGEQASAGMTARQPPPSSDERIAGWLEVIAWALIANAALFALFGAALLRRP